MSDLLVNHIGLAVNNFAGGQKVTEPLKTITTGAGYFGEVRAFFMMYYGRSDAGQRIDEPLRTITTKDRFGIVTVQGNEYQVVDIGMRMLQSRELFNAQGFPMEYIINLDYDRKRYSQAAQMARSGNVVSPPFAKTLVEVNLPELWVEDIAVS